MIQSIGPLLAAALMVTVVPLLDSQDLVDSVVQVQDVEATAEDAALEYLRANFGLTTEQGLRQLTFAAQAEQLTPYIRTQLAGSFSGVWVDNAQPGVLFVRTTNPNRAEALLASLALPSKVVAAKYTQQELIRGTHEAIELLETFSPRTLGGGRAFAVEHDVQGNEIDVSLAPNFPNSPELQAALAAFEPRLEVQPSPQWRVAVSDECEVDNCPPPLRGGTKVVSSTGSGCTLGFTFIKNGARYASTAGHCRSSPWEHNSTNIGETAWSKYGDAVDAKMIVINRHEYWEPTNKIRFSAYHPAKGITEQVDDPRAGLVGKVLCISGKGRFQCGTLIHWQSAPSGSDLYDLGRIDTDSCGGDSGAPVTAGETFRAYGMHSTSTEGCYVDGGDSWFSWVAYIEAQSGYALLLW